MKGKKAEYFDCLKKKLQSYSKVLNLTLFINNFNGNGNQKVFNTVCSPAVRTDTFKQFEQQINGENVGHVETFYDFFQWTLDK